MIDRLVPCSLAESKRQGKADAQAWSSKPEPLAQSTLTLFPNPTDGLLEVKIAGSAQLQSVEVYNLQGKRMLVQQCNGGGVQCSLNLGGLPAGLYAVVGHTSTGVMRANVVVR